MQEHSVLGQVALGYSPMTDRQRSVVATRLTVFPDKPDAVPDAQALLRALDAVWVPLAAAEGDIKLTLRALDAPSSRHAAAAPAAAGNGQPPVSLNIASEALLLTVMQALQDGGAASQRMVEVPAFMAADPAHAAVLRGLRAAGGVLMLKGRPLSPLPPDMLGLFTHSIVDVAEERRAPGSIPPGGVVRSVSSVQVGARTRADIDAAFQRGAVAVLGWPFDDPLQATGRSSIPADVKTVLDLIHGVEREDAVPKLEAVLKRDPTIAFRLMRYLNSPAFGLRVEINSFAHALMLLGYNRLKRWLALLLASSAKDANAKPVMFAAVRRGLLMEELSRGQGDAEMTGEMFICGVFSLLDRLLQQPFSELLSSVPVPERVQQALRGEGGPYLPYLDLVRAIESETLFDIREAADRVFLSTAEVNRALFVALQSARQID